MDGRFRLITNIVIMLSFVVTMICFVVIAVSLVSHVNWADCSFSHDYMGNIGDFLSGTIGVFFAFVSFLLMWRTISIQRKQFREQDNLQRQASFETTFFNLLNSLDDVRANAISILSHSDNKTQSMGECYKKMRDCFKASDSVILVQCSDVESQIEATEGKVAEIYESFVEKQGYAGFYFRYIYNVIRFTLDYWKDYSMCRKYIDQLCARLSDEELSLIFYNALSKYGLDQNERLRFKDLLDTYQVFENLNMEYLVDRSHFRFYPHTDFKFLTRDERKAYLKNVNYNLL